MRKRTSNRHDLDIHDDMGLKNEEKAYVEPKEWTIITAFERVLDKARNSKLSDDFWSTVKNPLAYLREQLELTDMQIIIVAIMAEEGEPLSWRMIGEFLNISRLAMMCYSEEVEGLLAKRWVVHRGAYEGGSFFEGFALEHGVVTALRHNMTFVPDTLECANDQEFMDRLEKYLDTNLNNHNDSFDDMVSWTDQLVRANSNLPICKEAMRFEKLHDRFLLLLVAYDYAQWADSDDEGLTLHDIDKVYPGEWKCDRIRRNLRQGTHIMISEGLIEHKCEDGIANTERYVLSQRVKSEMLSDYEPSRSQCRTQQRRDRSLKSFSEIKEKPLFYNSCEEQQIERLTGLLSQDSLPDIQRRLEDEGMRKGFACLFYGAPGTGKTETVLQIARQTGRNIMQIDIAGLRDKFVGESEKNVKAIFTRYKKLCKNSDVMPILFFNEADAIFTKRTSTGSNPAVEKMENSMQNIILQELENLEGILIATTNLTCNLDDAFERRFLFKVEFKKPEAEVKAKIWMAMLKNISDEDAQFLAERYDFSGGQIENIARKRAIDYVLNGKFATLQELDTYCRAEFLDKKGSRATIGFKA